MSASGPALIVPSTDSDLFSFTTLEAGPVTVRVTTVGSTLNPKIRIFGTGPLFTEIPRATSNGDTASLSFPATAIGQVSYILVLPNNGATGGAAVGSYTVQVTGTLPAAAVAAAGPTTTRMRASSATPSSSPLKSAAASAPSPVTSNSAPTPTCSSSSPPRAA